MSNDTQTVEVSLSELSDYGRAKRDPTPEAVENLSKSEAIYTICSMLDVDTPDGAPSDHNGNVPKSLVREWVTRLAEYRASYGDPEGSFDSRMADVAATVPTEEEED